jgi:hypothetical protein
VKLAEIPAFAPNGTEGRAYGLEEIDAASSRRRFGSGCCNGSLHWISSWGAARAYLGGIHDELGVIHVRRSIWRGIVGEPKTKKSKGAIPIIPQLAESLAAYRKSIGNPEQGPMFTPWENLWT